MLLLMMKQAFIDADSEAGHLCAEVEEDEARADVVAVGEGLRHHLEPHVEGGGAEGHGQGAPHHRLVRVLYVKIGSKFAQTKGKNIYFQ